jgi:hypothetical protein
MPAGEREGWPARVASWSVCKEREEKRREEEEIVGLAEIRLKFEKFKILSKWW